MKRSITIAACQVPIIYNDIRKSLEVMLEYAVRAEEQGAKLVCFPECYLQGYIVDDQQTAQIAHDLSSLEFQAILQPLSKVKSILVFGVIERHEQRLFNTAVVVQHGELLGRYRKTKLLPGENIFEAGHDYPVFEVDQLKFGINICYDMNFPECADAVAKQNAHLLVCPSNNMMRYENAEKWKDKHNESRIQRARESGLWILSSDVTGEMNDRISYGPTALIDPQGKIVVQVPLLEEGLLVHDIAF